MIRREGLLCLLVGAVSLHAQPPAKKFELSKEEQQLFDLINAERKKKDLSPLKANPLLFKVARAHSANMAEQQKMVHELDGKKPSERLKDAGYKYAFTGENIAAIYRDMEKLVEAWMGSEFHRNNILSDLFTETGIGIVRDSLGKTVSSHLTSGLCVRSNPSVLRKRLFHKELRHTNAESSFGLHEKKPITYCLDSTCANTGFNVGKLRASVRTRSI
jgi:hypothetical protein